VDKQKERNVAQAVENQAAERGRGGIIVGSTNWWGPRKVFLPIMGPY